MLHHREWATFKVLWRGCLTYICRCAGNSIETRPVTAGEGPRGGLGNNHSVRRGPLATCILQHAFIEGSIPPEMIFCLGKCMFFECSLENLKKWMRHAATCSNMQQHAALEAAETCKTHAFSLGKCMFCQIWGCQENACVLPAPDPQKKWTMFFAQR